MKKSRIRRINDAVMYFDADVIKMGANEIDRLKKNLKTNAGKKCRFCAHKSGSDIVHEMFIAHTPDTYVRPHKHIGKPEAFYIIEGKADVILFDERGKIRDVISMGKYGSGKIFYYRLQKPFFHTVIIRSDPFIFHEITKGPFKKSDTVFAKWSPAPDNKIAVREFIKKLSRDAERFLKS